MTLRFGKAFHSHVFVAVMSFAVSLSMACGRSGLLLGADDEGEAADDAGAAGRTGGATSAKPGGAGAGGGSKSSGIGGASTTWSSASKPVGSGGSGGGAGKSTVTVSSTKPDGGAGGAVGGASALAGSRASGGAVGGVSALAGSKASGGVSTVGGSTSTASCNDAKACGGDVVGTWNVTSSCLTVNGQLDMSAYGLDCSRATINGSLRTTGFWIAKANGVYSDKTITSGSLQISLPASCLRISGSSVRCKDMASLFMSVGFGSVVCNDAAGGGCTCPVTINQSGSMGLISLTPWSSGVYETNGNVLVIDSTNRYGYCVLGTQMTLTPQGENPPMTGAIVFQKQ